MRPTILAAALLATAACGDSALGPDGGDAVPLVPGLHSEPDVVIGPSSRIAHIVWQLDSVDSGGLGVWTSWNASFVNGNPMPVRFEMEFDYMDGDDLVAHLPESGVVSVTVWTNSTNHNGFVRHLLFGVTPGDANRIDRLVVRAGIR